MTAATRSTACPSCSAPLVEIGLVQAGTSVVMRSCSGCDTRWWVRDGEHVALGAVLATVAGAKKPAGRKLVAAG
jgi:hypothetical protein